MPQWWQRIIEQQRAAGQSLPPVPFTPTAPMQRRFIPATMAPQDTSQGQIMTGAPGYGTPGGTDSILSPPVGPPSTPQGPPMFGERGPMSPMAEQMGVTGADAALPGAQTPGASNPLLGIAQLMSQPLIGKNEPLLQAGAILSGFSAGMRGQQNPVIQQLLAERETQTNRAVQLSTLGLHMQQANAKAAEDKYKQTKDRADLYKSVGEIGIKSDNPTFRKHAIDLIGKAAKLLGGDDLSPDLVQGIVEGAVTQAKNKNAFGLLLGGMPPDAVAQYLDMPLPVVNSLLALSGNPKSFLAVQALTGVDPQDIIKTGNTIREQEVDILAKGLGLAVGEIPSEARLLVWDKGLNPKQIPLAQMDAKYRASVLDAVRTAYEQMQIEKGRATVANQPVPFDAAKGTEMLSEASSLSKGLYDLVTKHEAELSKYTGVRGLFGLREAVKKQFGGGVSDPVKLTFLAFDAIRNNMSTVQKGAALGPGELALFQKVYTDAAKWNASFQDLKFAAFYAETSLPIIEKRMSLLQAPGGRGQLIARLQGSQAYEQYANEVRSANPLPSVDDLLKRYKAKQPGPLPPGWGRDQ